MPIGRAWPAVPELSGLVGGIVEQMYLFAIDIRWSDKTRQLIRHSG